MTRLFAILGMSIILFVGCRQPNNDYDELEYEDYSTVTQKDTKGKLLFKGKYTLTGRFIDSDKNQGNSFYFNAFYLEIYEKCLVETSNSPYNPIAEEYVYQLISKDKKYLTYSNSNQNAAFMVDRNNYNVCKSIIMPDYRFGDHANRFVLYEVVKGDQTQQLTQQLNQAYQYEAWRSIMD